jgi:probable selenium-dependent hydroxylase accessory protein YqeC
LSLLRALRVNAGDVVSVAGAGGKTTLVYRLAQEAQRAGLRVIVTTTTHMGTLPSDAPGPVLVEEEGDILPSLNEALATHGRATVLGRRLREDKLEGLAPERVDSLRRLADLVIVEADGARGRSLKVPAAHEPVVPQSTTLLVVLAALDVLGSPLGEERVHRVDEVRAATGLAAGSTVDEEAMIAALLAPDGYLRHFTPGRRTAVFLNKAETLPSWSAAARISRRLVPPYGLVAAGSAREGSVEVWW